MQYGEGRAGAVNGMKPNGKVDITSMQSEEVWIGVNDALASLMIYEVTLYFYSLIIGPILCEFNLLKGHE